MIAHNSRDRVRSASQSDLIPKSRRSDPCLPLRDEFVDRVAHRAHRRSVRRLRRQLPQRLLLLAELRGQGRQTRPTCRSPVASPPSTTRTARDPSPPTPTAHTATREPHAGSPPQNPHGAPTAPQPRRIALSPHSRQSGPHSLYKPHTTCRRERRRHRWGSRQAVCCVRVGWPSTDPLPGTPTHRCCPGRRRTGSAG